MKRKKRALVSTFGFRWGVGERGGDRRGHGPACDVRPAGKSMADDYMRLSLDWLIKRLRSGKKAFPSYTTVLRLVKSKLIVPASSQH